jgi:hypothetical protein
VDVQVTRQKEKRKIDLVATQENDYGVGAGTAPRLSFEYDLFLITLSAYWKGNKSQSQSQSQNAVFRKRSHQSSKTEIRKGTRGTLIDDLSEEEIAEQVTPHEDEGVVPLDSSPESRRPELEKVQPLFLDDDDEEDAGKRRDLDAAKKPPTKPSSRKPKKSSRRVVHQDSEDEGATFKGFRGRK